MCREILEYSSGKAPAPNAFESMQERCLPHLGVLCVLVNLLGWHCVHPVLPGVVLQECRCVRCRSEVQKLDAVS